MAPIVCFFKHLTWPFHPQFPVQGTYDLVTFEATGRAAEGTSLGHRGDAKKDMHPGAQTRSNMIAQMLAEDPAKP
jgi:hypothetical protein